MTKKPRNHVEDLRGASRLAIEATRGVTDLVKAMHLRIASGPAILGQPLQGPVRTLTGLVYGTIRGVTALVGASIDLALSQLGPLLGESAPGLEREAILSAINGVLGDYLETTNNPLAIPMHLNHRGPAAGNKLLLLIHGSSMGDLQWTRAGHDHGAALAKDLGYTPVYLHYNSGRHISTNGRALADLLEAEVAGWPVPLDELAILAHSMGGLVARAACNAARESGHRWPLKLKKLICLGSPHHGAPLERGGNWIELLLGISSYSAPLARLGKIRSAGVTDLRYGLLRDEDWADRDRFEPGPDLRRPLPLPEGVQCYAVAASKSLQAGGALAGDGLVTVDSALGRHPTPELTLAFPADHQWVGLGMNHLDLLSRKEVYEVIKGWLSP